MELYKIDRFDLDCTYSKGVFWRNLPQPVHKTDLNPQTKDTIKANSGDLPFDSTSMDSIMFDPPFVIIQGVENPSGIISGRFGHYSSFKDLKTHYYQTFEETYRILKPNGFLVFKCQDTVASGKNYFTHSLVMNMGLDVGFYPKDLFLLMAKNTVIGGNWKTQIHARKHHSYFWVFQKKKCPIDY